MMMMIIIWIIWKMEKLCRKEIFHMYWGKHFLLYKRIKRQW